MSLTFSSPATAVVAAVKPITSTAAAANRHSEPPRVFGISFTPAPVDRLQRRRQIGAAATLEHTSGPS